MGATLLMCGIPRSGRDSVEWAFLGRPFAWTVCLTLLRLGGPWFRLAKPPRKNGHSQKGTRPQCRPVLLPCAGYIVDFWGGFLQIVNPRARPCGCTSHLAESQSNTSLLFPLNPPQAQLQFWSMFLASKGLRLVFVHLFIGLFCLFCLLSCFCAFLFGL